MNEQERARLRAMSARSQAWADLRQYSDSIEKVANREIEGNEVLIRKVCHIVMGDLLSNQADVLGVEECEQ